MTEAETAVRHFHESFSAGNATLADEVLDARREDILHRLADAVPGQPGSSGRGRGTACP